MGGGRALLRYMKCEIRIRPSSADGGRELDVEGGAQGRGLGCSDISEIMDATELFLGFSFLLVKLYSLALALQVSFRSPPTFLFSEEMGRNVFR